MSVINPNQHLDPKIILLKPVNDSFTTALAPLRVMGPLCSSDQSRRCIIVVIGKKVTGKKVTEKKSQFWVGKKVTGKKVTRKKVTGNKVTI